MEIIVRCWVKIQMGKSPNNYSLMYYKKDLPFEIFHKWKWYFDYRAALFKVQNPKLQVDYRWGSEKWIPEKEEKIKRLKDKIIAQKRLITKINNQWSELVNSWNSLFPIETDPRYPATIKKINEHKCKLNILEEELHELQLLSKNDRNILY